MFGIKSLISKIVALAQDLSLGKRLRIPGILDIDKDLDLDFDDYFKLLTTLESSSFFETDRAAKIGWSLTPNHLNQIELS